MTKTIFSCNSCNYSTRNKYDWNKHILTKKHTRNTSIKNGTINLLVSNNNNKLSIKP